MIETTEQFLDHILEMVQYSEDDFESALAATVTIYSLIQRGYQDLGFEVLKTYGPQQREEK